MDEPKPRTIATTPMNSAALTPGAYTWPSSASEVWRIVSRGRNPSCTAWRVTENAPEMSACDAITVASVASSTIGMRAQCGISRKNGLSIAFGEPRISEPWPR